MSTKGMKLRPRGLWVKIDKQADGGCWIWRGHLNRGGYGQFGRDGKLYLVHRVVYTDLVGPIPEGMQLDHLCRVRACCNPAHLEIVTNRQNWERGLSPTRLNRDKTRCPAGHAYTPENTIVEGPGKRKCRRCKNRRDRESREKLPACPGFERHWYRRGRDPVDACVRCGLPKRR